MKILICGDFIVYGKPIFSLNNVFGDFSNIIKESDISIYNQEFPITNHPNVFPAKKHGITPATDPQVLSCISYAGFTHATLANNHILNRGAEGVKDTINNLEGVGVRCFGAGLGLPEASKIHYQKNKKHNIAFLNYAENEYNTATDNHAGANPLDVINVVNDIKEAKKHADYVFLIIHGGIDYCKIPSTRMVKWYRFFADQGASAIVGHHSHVVSGYEIYNKVPIFYGIGNFVPGKIVTKDCLYSSPVQFHINNDGTLTFKVFSLVYNETNKCIEQLKGDKLKTFLNDQKHVSGLLADTKHLKDALISNYLKTEREAYYSTLFTRSNYFVFKVLRKLGFMSIYHKYVLRKMRLTKKNSALWNLFRCETHNDVLNLIYEKYIDTYNN